MELIIKNSQTKIKVSDKVFNVRFNGSLVHQVVKSYLSNLRVGTKSQKNRSQVSGSNRKPWKQKGTGHARSGSVKSPIWRSGGMTFATKERSYEKKINRKMYNNAMRCIFSELVRKKRIIVIPSLIVNDIKTKLFEKMITNISENECKTLVVTKKSDERSILSSRNLHRINVCNISQINPVVLIKHRTVIFTIEAIKAIEERLIT
ncbi:50S ribosomal protein L4 [Candidatus Riesia pediculischaeffi]|uniref:Large ribosomal subunit protein uL4 n=2 Tax=Candidatus Riesia pediculischaeffi TaxID=428411 RepID=A0A1V0HK52_9ENTR|nr:50S ribosomal protein L4 [Candidatus Riesia pediculischaeffi]ARC53209.1 50S ribosomal protein L4 [Candidatus Riesia pediculischaeffi]KIE64144.1 LSU ribosomal protein L4p (L1e) [Candidatus Riesia pediculischaeffi PTSU]